MSRPLVVILGGTRSGKSRLGRERAAELAVDGAVAYIGTALPGDPELEARIALHRADRPSTWTTIEPGRDLVTAIDAIPSATTLLLDGLTLWVSQLLGDDVDAQDVAATGGGPDVGAIVDGPIEALRAALEAHPGPAIVVSDEVGLGTVPMSPVARAFRDVLGIAHQRLVADADEAWLTVAGRALRLDDGRRIG